MPWWKNDTRGRSKKKKKREGEKKEGKNQSNGKRVESVLW